MWTFASLIVFLSTAEILNVFIYLRLMLHGYEIIDYYVFIQKGGGSLFLLLNYKFCWFVSIQRNFHSFEYDFVCVCVCFSCVLLYLCFMFLSCLIYLFCFLNLYFLFLLLTCFFVQNISEKWILNLFNGFFTQRFFF